MADLVPFAFCHPLLVLPFSTFLVFCSVFLSYAFVTLFWSGLMFLSFPCCPLFDEPHSYHPLLAKLVELRFKILSAQRSPMADMYFIKPVLIGSKRTAVVLQKGLQCTLGAAVKSQGHLTWLCQLCIRST